MKKIITLTVLAVLCHFASFAVISSMSGVLGVCVGTTTTLIGDSTSMGSGTWTSSTPSVATIGLTSGAITGLSAGTTTITYVLGSATSTAVFTVSAAPASISGPTTICTSGTATLTNSVAGGTWWSSNAAVATIGASTGIVNGVGGGYASMRYTMGPGCFVSSSMYVTTGAWVDSIEGPFTICIGGTGTLTNMTTGGTWSSSNPSVATIGASTGVVSGVSAGTSMITYSVVGSCGTGTRTQMITVSGTTATGTIYGTGSVTVGATTTLYNTAGGGTWSSSTASVATISSTGVVTGVTAGTATITYTRTGCGGTAYTTTVVTVNTLDVISGNVLFGSAPFYGAVKVWLIKYNPSTLMLSACDSATMYCSGAPSVYYQFLSKPTDSYRVKAAVYDSSTFASTGYIPTYHTASFYWSAATVIPHTAGTADINKNINMAYGSSTSGPGFVAGNVTTGANKGTAGGAPAVGLLIIAINQSTGMQVAQDVTDATGSYSFSNLPLGTYKIYPELINYGTTPYTSITLTSGTPSMAAANFEQHTLSHTITPNVVGVNELHNTGSSVAVFPSPAANEVAIQWSAAGNESGTVTISDVAGRNVYHSELAISNGSGVKNVDVSGFTNGLYIISVKSASINYTSKIEVRH
ncbi:MAG: T9SS type A sorting domain-containing protein [Bacteroidota bacterium]